jgi:hypothetical protein
MTSTQVFHSPGALASYTTACVVGAGGRGRGVRRAVTGRAVVVVVVVVVGGGGGVVVVVFTFASERRKLASLLS